MTLQSSGAISLAQVQTEYGGSNPISFNEYLRNGTYVNVYGTSYFNSTWGDSDKYYIARRTDLTNEYLYWNSQNSIGTVANGAFSYGDDTITIGDFTYDRHTQEDSVYFGNAGTWILYWRVRRKYVGSANNNIPTSASNIGMNDFYGGIGSD